MKMLLMILFLSIFCLILLPAQAVAGATEGLRLCGTAVIPALLPFLFLTRLIVSYLPQAKSSKSYLGISSQCWPAVLLGFIGGYPTGVSAAVSLYETGKASKQDVQNTLRVCNNSGPGFFVSIIGLKLFQKPLVGFILYGIHLLSGILILLMNSTGSASYSIRRVPDEEKSFHQTFQEALVASCSTMLQICGTVILFSTLLSILRIILPAQLLPLSGFLEITTGILSLNASPTSFVLCSIFMGWGGLCVHAQALSLWHRAGIAPKGYWRGKLLHGTLSGILAYCLLLKNWIYPGLLLIIILAFSLFRKKWGRKKQIHAL